MSLGSPEDRAHQNALQKQREHEARMTAAYDAAWRAIHTVSPATEAWLIPRNLSVHDLRCIMRLVVPAVLAITSARRERRRDTLLIQMVNAYNSGAVEMRSADIDLGDPAIAPHPWHEEWIAAARSEIDAMGAQNAENQHKIDQA